MEVEIGNYMQNFGPTESEEQMGVTRYEETGVEILNVAESDIDELEAQGLTPMQTTDLFREFDLPRQILLS
jgi:hypothetical protein